MFKNHGQWNTRKEDENGGSENAHFARVIGTTCDIIFVHVTLKMGQRVRVFEGQKSQVYKMKYYLVQHLASKIAEEHKCTLSHFLGGLSTDKLQYCRKRWQGSKLFPVIALML